MCTCKVQYSTCTCTRTQPFTVDLRPSVGHAILVARTSSSNSQWRRLVVVELRNSVSCALGRSVRLMPRDADSAERATTLKRRPQKLCAPALREYEYDYTFPLIPHSILRGAAAE